MKIPSTTAFAALAAFTALPAAFAQDAAEPVLPELAICIAYPVEEFTEEFTEESTEEFTEKTTEEEFTEETTEEEFTEEYTEEEFTEEYTEEEFTEDSTDGEVEEITTEEEGSEPGDGVEVTGWPDGGVPIEWVIRGGGGLDNPDVMFYSSAGGPMLQNMAGGPIRTADQSTGDTAPRVLNQGETAADIEGATTGGAGLGKAAKKSTVAIVKQGRVFLR